MAHISFDSSNLKKFVQDNELGELINYSGFEKLLERMQNHFTDDEIDKISHKNALRLINDILPSK